MNRALKYLKIFLFHRFNLLEDKAPDEEILDSVKRGMYFRGANLWALIFAIFIASIGLNVNSTAVIIGAMLISPLMGPIMGVGVGIGINDLDLVKKGLRNLLVATLISITTSTIYFWLTPLHQAQSELLARTSPTLWDVFIAFFGGLAGIVAATRTEKNNVIPGVAIATALMPPLCTAGFGIANGNWYYFLGAIYLYFINSLFICLAAYLIVRFMGLHKKQFEDKDYKKKVNRIILLLVIITITPSIYLAYRIVNKSIFENNARSFVDREFNFRNPQVITKTFNAGKKEIDVLLLGKELSASRIDSLKAKLSQYNLDGTQLIIRQGLNAKNEIDFSQIKASILQDVFKNDSITNIQQATAKFEPGDIKEEFHSLYPDLLQYSISDATFNRLDTPTTATLTLVLADFKKPISRVERTRLYNWLKTRMRTDTLRLVIN